MPNADCSCSIVTPDRPIVMAGLVPGIHVFAMLRFQDVDARYKAGYDG